MQLQLFHVGDDGLVLRQPAAVHIGSPLRERSEGGCWGLCWHRLGPAKLLRPE